MLIPNSYGATIREGNWIQSAIKRPGQLHRDLGVPQGKKIPLGMVRQAAKQKGKIGQRARACSGARAMQSCRKSPRRSSAPTARAKVTLNAERNPAKGWYTGVEQDAPGTDIPDAPINTRSTLA